MNCCWRRKVATVVFAILIVLASLWFASMKQLTIFDLMVNFGNMVGLPISHPADLGHVHAPRPAWAGWSTVLVGLLTSYLDADVSRLRAGPDTSWASRSTAARPAHGDSSAARWFARWSGSAWFVITP